MNDILACNTLALDQNAVLILYTCCTIIFIAGCTWYSNIILQKTIVSACHSRKIEETFTKAIQNIAGIAVYAIGLILILENLHIQMSAFFGALGFAAIGISLALQNIMLNIASGIFLLVYKPFCIGDYIKNESTTLGFEGRIIDINLRCTTLAYNDEFVIVPNATLYSSIVKIKKSH